MASNFNFGEFKSYIKMNNMSAKERQNCLKILISQLSTKIYGYFQPIFNNQNESIETLKSQIDTK